MIKIRVSAGTKIKEDDEYYLRQYRAQLAAREEAYEMLKKGMNSKQVLYALMDKYDIIPDEAGDGTRHRSVSGVPTWLENAIEDAEEDLAYEE